MQADGTTGDWTPSTLEVRGSELAALVRRHNAVAVHFWAGWHPGTPAMDSNLRAMGERFGNRLIIASCNVHEPENLEFCMRYGVSSVLTVVVFVSGKPQRPIIVGRDREKLAAEIEARLNEGRKPWWAFWR